MQYLTIRWFTLSHFDEERLRLFHSLEKGLKKIKTNDINLCWHVQTENFLKKEFKKITSKMNNLDSKKLKNFDDSSQYFLSKNKISDKLVLKNINFLQKCDKIIYHRTHR